MLIALAARVASAAPADDPELDPDDEEEIAELAQRARPYEDGDAGDAGDDDDLLEQLTLELPDEADVIGVADDVDVGEGGTVSERLDGLDSIGITDTSDALATTIADREPYPRAKQTRRAPIGRVDLTLLWRRIEPVVSPRHDELWLLGTWRP